MTKVWEQDAPFLSGYPITQQWVALDLAIGPHTITVNYGPPATNGHGIVCMAVDLYNVYQGQPGNPLSALDGFCSETSAKNNLDGKVLPDGTTCLPPKHCGDFTDSTTEPNSGDVDVRFYYTTAYAFSKQWGGQPPNAYVTNRTAGCVPESTENQRMSHL